MAPSNIRVVLGENLELLQYSAQARRSNQVVEVNRPHGFSEAWDEGRIAQLCELVRQRFEQILATMPNELLKHVAEGRARIPLYALFCPNSSFEACVMGVVRTGRPKNSIPEFGGILFNSAKVQPQDLDNGDHSIHENIWHELGHITTSEAVNSSETISEAFANGVSGKFIDPSLTTNLDAQSVKTTTGLRLPDDMSQHPQSAGYTQALYLASPLALRDIDIQRIWEIVIQLTKDQSSELMPGSSDILRAIRNVLGGDADKILQRPVFDTIKVGNHQLMFPESNRGAVFTTAFKAEASASGIQISDKTIDISIEAIGGNGAMVENPSMAGVKRIQYDGLIKIFDGIQGVDTRNITGFKCKLGSFSFELRENQVLFNEDE